MHVSLWGIGHSGDIHIFSLHWPLFKQPLTWPHPISLFHQAQGKAGQPGWVLALRDGCVVLPPVLIRQHVLL